MACDVGTTVYVLFIAPEPDISYIKEIHFTEESAICAVTALLGIEPTWLPKRTNALHLAGYVEANTGNNLFPRGCDVAIEQHVLTGDAC